MKVKGIVDTDFVNYKKPSLYIIFPNCTFKCGKNICHNYNLANENNNLDISIDYILELYNNNPITKAFVFGGLEPFESFEEMYELISRIRDYCADDIVIYTGYYPYEILDELKKLNEFDSLIFKFGRYVPNNDSHYDEVLGIKLASDNQYGAKMVRGKINIIDGLINRQGFCPCRITQNDNTLCSCKEFREDGECHCGLFKK